MVRRSAGSVRPDAARAARAAPRTAGRASDGRRAVKAAHSAALAGLLIAGCSAPAANQGAARPSASSAATSSRAAPSPAHPAPSPATGAAPAHTLVVMLENHSYGEVIGNGAAPFLNKLARSGALFTRSHAITHPSQPNYLVLTCRTRSCPSG